MKIVKNLIILPVHVFSTIISTGHLHTLDALSKSFWQITSLYRFHSEAMTSLILEGLTPRGQSAERNLPGTIVP